MNTVEQRWFDALKDDVEPWEVARFNDRHDREDAFVRDVAFGTGGIRALMGIGPNRLNMLTVARASAGLAAYLHTMCDSTPLVAIAYDTRIHSRDFAIMSARVLAAAGVRAVIFGEPQPTPVLSFAVRWLGADAGIVLTASHNSMEYNGFKVYDSMSDQATDELVHAVQAAIQTIDPFDVPAADFTDAMRAGIIAWASDEVFQAYVDAVTAQSTGISCADVKLAYSPLNGTGLVSVQRVCANKGIDLSVVPEQEQPDGTFPTCPKPNPEHAEAMQYVMDLALHNDCDLAIANDPDADRIGIAARHDGCMQLLSGDEIGMLLFDFLCKAAPLSAHPVAMTTIVSTPLHDAIAQANGIALRRTLTGFKYIGEQINLMEKQGRSDDFLVGVEESCGYLRGVYVHDKDGIVALMLACELAAYHKSQGKDLVQALEELYKRYGYMMAQQVAVELPGTEGREAIATIMARLRADAPTCVGDMAVLKSTDYARGAAMPGDASQKLPTANVFELALEHGCKLIVRPSGTEPKIKAYCFASGTSACQATQRLNTMTQDVRHMLST